jgi:hypothetical protein
MSEQFRRDVETCQTDDYHVRIKMGETCLEATYEDGDIICLAAVHDGYTPPDETYICVSFFEFIALGATLLAEKARILSTTE